MTGAADSIGSSLLASESHEVLQELEATCRRCKPGAESVNAAATSAADPAARSFCERLWITGHSLGASMALLAAFNVSSWSR